MTLLDFVRVLPSWICVMSVCPATLGITPCEVSQARSNPGVVLQTTRTSNEKREHSIHHSIRITIFLCFSLVFFIFSGVTGVFNGRHNIFLFFSVSSIFYLFYYFFICMAFVFLRF
ncbi:hypothetical protein FPQ18DRAFT_143324 [Pyronema domesticum]|nr:hypothetical protein FPQ18DRAFT_143324 [Pyronema domesticum]